MSFRDVTSTMIAITLYSMIFSKETCLPEKRFYGSLFYSIFRQTIVGHEGVDFDVVSVEMSVSVEVPDC